MLIGAYGMFWERDEVDWHPGHGKPFRLLGHVGERAPKLRVVDFREERGLYVLFSNHGPRHVGVATGERLGDRLRDHIDNDGYLEPWDRFCWFGFRRVLEGRHPDGTRKLARKLETAHSGSSQAIRALEAILIHVLGTRDNLQRGRFPGAEEWEQVRRDEVDDYLRRVRR